MFETQESKPPTTIGRLIRELRRRPQLSLRAAAHWLGLSAVELSRIERHFDVPLDEAIASSHLLAELRRAERSGEPVLGTREERDGEAFGAVNCGAIAVAEFLDTLEFAPVVRNFFLNRDPDSGSGLLKGEIYAIREGAARALREFSDDLASRRQEVVSVCSRWVVKQTRHVSDNFSERCDVVTSYLDSWTEPRLRHTITFDGRRCVLPDFGYFIETLREDFEELGAGDSFTVSMISMSDFELETGPCFEGW